MYYIALSRIKGIECFVPNFDFLIPISLQPVVAILNFEFC